MNLDKTKEEIIKLELQLSCMKMLQKLEESPDLEPAFNALRKLFESRGLSLSSPENHCFKNSLDFNPTSIILSVASVRSNFSYQGEKFTLALYDTESIDIYPSDYRTVYGAKNLQDFSISELLVALKVRYEEKNKSTEIVEN